VDGQVGPYFCALEVLDPTAAPAVEQTYAVARDRTPLACWSDLPQSIDIPGSDPVDPLAVQVEHAGVLVVVCAYGHADDGLPNLLQGACMWDDQWKECF